MILRASVRRSQSSLRPQREGAALPPPTIIDMADCDRLGELRGRQWVTHRGTEYRLDDWPFYDSNPLIRLWDGRSYVRDTDRGELIYFAAMAFPLGTFANGGRRLSPPRARRPARQRGAANSSEDLGA